MSRYAPKELYYHSCEAVLSTLERLREPLHYHLRRGDVVAFRRELRAGGNPFALDGSQRTPLDLLITIVEDLLVTAFCTSFPIDSLFETILIETTFPAKFGIYDQYESMANMNRQPQQELLRALPFRLKIPHSKYSGHPVRRNVAIPKQFTDHDRLPQHAFDPIAYDPKPCDAKQPEPYPAGKPSSNQDIFTYHSRLAKQGHPGIEQSYQQMCMVACDDAFKRPLSFKVIHRMKGLYQRLKALNGLIEEMATCDLLMAAVIQRRAEKHFAVKGIKNDYKGNMRIPQFVNEWRPGFVERLVMESDQKVPIFLKDFGFPFLYSTILRILHERYRMSPYLRPWRVNSPGDTRRLAMLICRFRMEGYRVLGFLCLCCQEMYRFLSAVTTQFVMFNTEVLDFLVHGSFVLDCPELFKLLSENYKGTWSPYNSKFDWPDTIDEVADDPQEYKHFALPIMRTTQNESVRQHTSSSQEDQVEPLDIDAIPTHKTDQTEFDDEAELEMLIEMWNKSHGREDREEQGDRRGDGTMMMPSKEYFMAGQIGDIGVHEDTVPFPVKTTLGKYPGGIKGRICRGDADTENRRPIERRGSSSSKSRPADSSLQTSSTRRSSKDKGGNTSVGPEITTRQKSQESKPPEKSAAASSK